MERPGLLGSTRGSKSHSGSVPQFPHLQWGGGGGGNDGSLQLGDVQLKKLSQVSAPPRAKGTVTRGKAAAGSPLFGFPPCIAGEEAALDPCAGSPSLSPTPES